MEEEPSSRKNLDEMETEQVGPSTKSFTPFVGVGPSGISPLVLSDPRLSVRTAVHQIPANRTLSPELRAAPAHRTGLAFHAAMLKHQCVCESSEQHPESPERLQFLLARLRDAGLLQDCLQVSMMGSLEQVESCHTEGHTLMFGTQRSILGQVDRLMLMLMLMLWFAESSTRPWHVKQVDRSSLWWAWRRLRHLLE